MNIEQLTYIGIPESGSIFRVDKLESQKITTTLVKEGKSKLPVGTTFECMTGGVYDTEEKWMIMLGNAFEMNPLKYWVKILDGNFTKHQHLVQEYLNDRELPFNYRQYDQPVLIWESRKRVMTDNSLIACDFQEFLSDNGIESKLSKELF